MPEIVKAVDKFIKEESEKAKKTKRRGEPRFFIVFLSYHHAQTEAKTPRTQNALKIAPKTGFFIALIDCTSRAKKRRKRLKKGIKSETAERTTQRQTRKRQKHARKRGKNGRKAHGRTNTRRKDNEPRKGKRNAKTGERFTSQRKHRRTPQAEQGDNRHHEKRTTRKPSPKKKRCPQRGVCQVVSTVGNM